MKSFLFFIVLTCTSTAWSQSDSIAQLEVRAVIDQLFDGMRTGDSTLVRSAFHSDASAFTSFKKNEADQLYKGSIDEFVSAVGSPHEEVWDERISNVVIQIDGGLAQVWMDYAFYLGDEFSHKGVNAMLLAKSNERWQIIQIADTRRKE